MRFALVDDEGATVDVFDDASEARDAIRQHVIEDGNLLAKLTVLEYRNGGRHGHPSTALDFIASDPKNMAAIAFGGGGPTSLKVQIVELAAEHNGVAEGIRVVDIDRRIGPGLQKVLGARRIGRDIAANRC